MQLSRRAFVGATALSVPALTWGSAALAAPQTDLTTPEGWLSWIRAHRDRISLSIDDGRGHRIEHDQHRPRPLASAVKVIAVAAYGAAVADGRLDPNEQVRMGDWERFYVPADGGGHANALRVLGIPTDQSGLYAADPNHRVRLDQMVDVTVRCSDSAAPDFLRHRLGLGALHLAAFFNGWFAPDIRSLCGEYLFLIFPEHAPAPDASVARRQSAGFRLERMYRDDPAMRAEALNRLGKNPPPVDKQLAWTGGTAAGSPAQLRAAHESLATDDSRSAKIAREHLEKPFREIVPPNGVAVGFKGGSLPGVLTGGMSLRRKDGTVATGALLAHDPGSMQALLTGDPLLALLLGVNDERWHDRLAQALAD